MSQALHRTRPLAGREEVRGFFARELPHRRIDPSEVEGSGLAMQPSAVECGRLVGHGTAHLSRRLRIAAPFIEPVNATQPCVELAIAPRCIGEPDAIQVAAPGDNLGKQEDAPEAASRFDQGPDFDSQVRFGDRLDSSPAQGSFPEEESSEIVRSRGDIVTDLYKSFYYRVFCFARRSVSDDEAEEIAHETFVRLLRVRNLERMTISVAYLLRIAENLLKRKHERATRYRSILERTGMVVPGGQEARANEPFGTRSRDEAAEWLDADRIDQALRRLTSEEQTAIRLIVCEGLDYQAAARSMGVRVSTINNWKHRGLAKLKQLVGIHRPASRFEPASAVSVAI